MGDFKADELWQASFMDVGPSTPCEGCHGRIRSGDDCYGHWDRIWHSRCWGKEGGELRAHEERMGRWEAPPRADLTAVSAQLNQTRKEDTP